MKTLFLAISLLIMTLTVATTLAQTPLSGLTITAKQQKLKGTVDKRLQPQALSEIQLDIEVFNSLPTTNSFNLDVFFIGTFNQGKDAHRFIRKLKMFQPSLQPMEKQTFSAESIPRQNQQPRIEINDFYPAGSHQFSTFEGYIIRASSGRTPLKVLTSSPALDRLAKDLNRMAALESGATVPVK
ncbi:MAG: hypothetical protein NT011_13565 [Kiritimatiellaeota bacterium]|nr:hypothetical protein [Kiritimatiellota bacterium]